MADQILHNANVVVDADGFVANVALRDSGVTADDYTSNNTQLASFTVDAKGRVTSASEASVNVTGVTFATAASDGTGTFEHAPNQKLYISTSAPDNDTIGNNGDIWYQTL